MLRIVLQLSQKREKPIPRLGTQMQELQPPPCQARRNKSCSQIFASVLPRIWQSAPRAAQQVLITEQAQKASLHLLQESEII